MRIILEDWRIVDDCSHITIEKGSDSLVQTAIASGTQPLVSGVVLLDSTCHHCNGWLARSSRLVIRLVSERVVIMLVMVDVT